MICLTFRTPKARLWSTFSMGLNIIWTFLMYFFICWQFSLVKISFFGKNWNLACRIICQYTHFESFSNKSDRPGLNSISNVQYLDKNISSIESNSIFLSVKKHLVLKVYCLINHTWPERNRTSKELGNQIKDNSQAYTMYCIFVCLFVLIFC